MLFAGLLLAVLLAGISVQAHAAWKKNTDGTYAYYKPNGRLLTSRWVGTNYYVGTDGDRLRGLQKIGKEWYFFASNSGKLYKDKWIAKAKCRYYASKDGALYADGIYKIGDSRYLFSEEAVMLTGKQTFQGKTYFFDSKNGKMLSNCWVRLSGEFYYFSSDGIMVTDKWLRQKNELYYVDDSGQRVSSSWKGDRYLSASGKACSGLHKIGGEYYYFDSTTFKKLTDSAKVLDGDTWVFDSDGRGEKCEVPAPSPGVQVQPTYYTHPLVDDETLLSYIIFCEAGNQPYEGQVAVGYVILNRLSSSLFRESTVREVVYAKGQFNPTWDGAMDRVCKNPSLVTAQCRRAAKKVVKMMERAEAGRKLYLTINGKKQLFPYLFFMVPSSYQKLHLTSQCIQIGGHVFFKVWK